MVRNKPLYEGKAKILYEGPDPGTLIQHFKDDATAFNNKKKGQIQGKGILNNRISEFIMTHLEEMGIPTHFIKSLNMREQLVRAVEIIPIEVVVRNITAGSLAKRFDVEEGMLLPVPLVEFYLKSDALDDPMLTEEHVVIFGWADEFELDEIRTMARRINDYLSGLFRGVSMKLVDFKIEFGRIYDEDGNMILVLADEISPDSCRLWDIETGEKMDKDRFRRDLGGVAEAYQEVARRLGIFTEGTNETEKVTPLRQPKSSGNKSKPSGGVAKKSKSSSAKKPVAKKETDTKNNVEKTKPAKKSKNKTKPKK